MKKAQLRNSGRQQLNLKLFVPVILTGILIIASALFFYLQLGTSKSVHAGVETFPSGSYIINMGVTPQTVQNGLKPYGLIYEMITTYKIPVKWIINGSKVKDGVDFVYNGVNYSGGCFLIHGDLITPAIQGRITYWNGLGVQGIYTTSALSVPVYNTINSFPRTVIDTLSGNQSIISNYFSNAGIPSTAYSLGQPSSITSCHDLWVNPHGDPVWSTHGALYNFSTVDKGYIWSQCHSVSMLENVSNPSSPSQKMNFLSTTGLQCYGSSKCGSVTEVHSKPPTAPYTNSFPSDPVMQFMGNLSGACLGGSEQWYVPLSTGSWRASTIRLVTTSNGASPREGVLMAYGPAHGNSANGLVMYLGGHDLNGNGSTAEKVAAQRAFLNFCLLAGKGKTPQLSSSSIQTSFVSGMTGSVSVNVTGGTAPYTYQWTSSISGTFGSPTAATTTFTPTLSGSNQNGSITLTITDACGRISFETRPITSSGSALPISLLWTKVEKITDAVMVKWATSSEKNNDFFTVHRSINNGTFEQIARVKGQGNSNSFKEYHYQDKMAPFGKLLYRISQTDYDGTTAIFEPVALTNLMEIKSAVIFPNPFSESADVRFDSETGGQVEIEIRNSKGQLIHRSTYSSQSGMNSFKMPGIESVPAGSYFLRIITDKKESKTIPFIKN